MLQQEHDIGNINARQLQQHLQAPKNLDRFIAADIKEADYEHNGIEKKPVIPPTQEETALGNKPIPPVLRPSPLLPNLIIFAILSQYNRVTENVFAKTIG